MAHILLEQEAVSATPAATRSKVYIDPTTKLLHSIDDNGKVTTPLGLFNASTASQAPAAADVYLAGSSVPLTVLRPRIGSKYVCAFDIVKTAAGVAAPVIIVRFGTLGTTGDAARLTFTFPAQTAIADTGRFMVECAFRSVGASGVLQGRASLVHKGPATGLTGLSIEPGPVVQVTSAGFDTTVANSIIGMSFNGGAAFAGTIQLVDAEVRNI